jgi:ubiquinone/menaquinone biosynthesis C-methylase UbiE
METDQKEVWKKRAERYNNLEWVHKKDIVSQLVHIGEFKSHETFLDAGTGTGKLATTIAPLVKEAHGLDLSPEMISQIKHNHANLTLKVGAIHEMDYSSDYFDKITARLVFHHILDDNELHASLKQCLRVLKKGGKMLISEGVPPHKDLKQDFIKIFKYKEHRRTFLPEELKSFMEQAGFSSVQIHLITDKGMSINNWIDNDGTISSENKQKIKDLHRNGSALFKEKYNLRETEDDILIDVTVAIVVGEKGE